MDSWDQGLHLALLFVLPIIAALILMVTRAITLSRRGHIQWGAEIPVRYEFARSWATNLTVVGTILALVLVGHGIGFSATSTLFVTGSDYFFLSLFFGLVALAAAFGCTAFRIPDREETNVAVFFVACGLTIWGFFGQLLAIGFFLSEVFGQHGMTGLLTWSFWIALVAAAIGTLWYAWHATVSVLPDLGRRIVSAVEDVRHARDELAALEAAIPRGAASRELSRASGDVSEVERSLAELETRLQAAPSELREVVDRSRRHLLEFTLQAESFEQSGESEAVVDAVDRARAAKSSLDRLVDASASSHLVPSLQKRVALL